MAPVRSKRMKGSMKAKKGSMKTMKAKKGPMKTMKAMKGSMKTMKAMKTKNTNAVPADPDEDLFEFDDVGDIGQEAFTQGGAKTHTKYHRRRR